MIGFIKRIFGSVEDESKEFVPNRKEWDEQNTYISEKYDTENPVLFRELLPILVKMSKRIDELEKK